MASILPPAHQEKVDPIHEFFKQEVFDFLEPFSWQQARPFILWGAAALAISFCLTFTSIRLQKPHLKRACRWIWALGLVTLLFGGYLMLPRDGKGMLMIIFGGFGGLIGLMMGTHYVCTNDHGQNRDTSNQPDDSSAELLPMKAGV